jgi:hypothetical protein
LKRSSSSSLDRFFAFMIRAETAAGIVGVEDVEVVAQ